MTRRKPGDDIGQAVVRWLMSNPKRNLPIALGVLLVVLVVSCIRHNDAVDIAVGHREPGEYLFCFWNVENLFDDRDERRPRDDEQYDNWFASDTQARNLKLQKLSEALIALNGGRGPDVIAAVEVESIRAAELLRDALNERIADAALRYQTVLMKEVSAGRHIAPAVITRLPVDSSATRLLNSRQRIVETRLTANGYDLTVIASHWTSRVSDKTGDRRSSYADAIYGAYLARVARNPEADVLICGDFNDSPDEPSVVTHLHGTADRSAVLRDGAAGSLLNLMAGKSPTEFGTHVHNGKRFIYDQIVVSRGMLDSGGWSCDPDSIRTIDTLIRPGDRTRRPWRFGNEKDDSFARGYSDHFPVTVRLKVQGTVAP